MSSSTSGATVTSSRPSSVLIRSVSLTPSLPSIVVCAARPVVSTCEPERVTRTVSARSRAVDGDGVGRAVAAAAEGGEVDVRALQVGAGEVVDGDGVGAAEGADVEASMSSKSMRDGGDVAGEPHARAVGGDVDVLADVGAVEVQDVVAALALDGVAAVARIPLEAVVAGAQQGGVGADVAVDEVVAGAAEQRVGAVAAAQRVVAGAAVDASGGSARRCRSGR